MTAHVVKAAQFDVARHDDDDLPARDIRGEEVAGIPQAPIVAHVEPLPAEDSVALALVDRTVVVPGRRKRDHSRRRSTTSVAASPVTSASAAPPRPASQRRT